MKHAKILKGTAFDWEKGKKAMDKAVVRGEVNWAAAFCADPGVMQCPSCGEFYWREGEEVECIECETVFTP